MNAYKTYAVITESKRLELQNLPFEQGQRVEILVIAEEKKALDKMKTLFEEIQNLETSKSITEEEIRAEILAYRHENRC
jgi:hypothetical protein